MIVSSRSSRLVWYAILTLQFVFVVYPMLWLLSISFRDSWSIFVDPWALPSELRWENYGNAWERGALDHKIVNSVLVDFAALAIALMLGSMVAYVVARFRFHGNRPLLFTFIGGMALPAFLGIVPLFILVTTGQQWIRTNFPLLGGGVTEWLNLADDRIWLALVYAAFSLPFTVFILTGFFRSLPGELAEAAAADGASPFLIFWRIMLPLAKPGMVTAGIFVFISLWNEYPLALVLLQKSEKVHTLPLGMANLTMTQKYQQDWGALFAGLTIGVIPTIIIYTLFQRQIQSGLTAGAVKG
ncbi:MAG: carbohydrate ABC transporter permease [Candidatus Sumerlaeaceae bacterium]